MEPILEVVNLINTIDNKKLSRYAGEEFERKHKKCEKKIITL